MPELITALWSDEAGQDLVEYVLLLLLIAIVAIVAVRGLGQKVQGVFNQANNQLTP